MATRDEEARALLTKEIRHNLYENSKFLNRSGKRRLGLLFDVPVYAQNPPRAGQTESSAIQEVEVHWEPGLDNGPTNSRFAVVDLDWTKRMLVPPVKWLPQTWQFEHAPGQLADASEIKERQAHQVSVWAIAQYLLDYFEHPFALGRSIGWGFDGGRLIIVPHAGYGEDSFYDRESKSLQFYYFGTGQGLRYTCLSPDIVAHHTGHAILDGIRPYYLALSSLETAAFHEYIADLAALIFIFNTDFLRSHLASVIDDYSRLEEMAQASDLVGFLTEEIGQQVADRAYLRSAISNVTMADVQDIDSPHFVATVLTAAAFTIICRITQRLLTGNEQQRRRAVTFSHAFTYAISQIRRIFLQPLDLCPPVDIRFLDYARALLRNDRLTSPEDNDGIRALISEEFHIRGLCRRTEHEHQQGICDLDDGRDERALRGRIPTDVDSIAHSRASAYHFLDNNRDAFRIPANHDFFIADLYETHKYSASAKRRPREIVLQYLWKEAVELDDPEFGSYQGSNLPLLCGGTLVFDPLGNILSWFHKPGLAHASDRQEGEQRRQELLDFVLARMRAGRVRLKVVDNELQLEIPARAHG